MRFDDNWGQQPEDSSASREIAPDGRHTGEIVSAQEKHLSFKSSDENPRGTCLVVVVELSKYQPVQVIVPQHWRGLIEAIARAAGVALPKPGEEWDETSLVGRTVTVDLLQAVSAKGTQYVRVEKWHPSPSQPLPAARAPARSQSAKAHREFQSKSAGDDVPF